MRRDDSSLSLHSIRELNVQPSDSHRIPTIINSSDSNSETSESGWSSSSQSVIPVASSVRCLKMSTKSMKRSLQHSLLLLFYTSTSIKIYATLILMTQSRRIFNRLEAPDTSSYSLVQSQVSCAVIEYLSRLKSFERRDDNRTGKRIRVLEK